MAAPEHCSVKTKQLRKKPYCKLGRSRTVLHNTQKTSDMSPLLALEISTQKWEHVLRNVICPSWKAIRVPCYCHCSPLDQAQMQQQLARTKEREESRCSHGHPERKGPRFSFVPTGKDALMLSKNYGLPVFCAPGIHTTHHQWGGPRQGKY